MPALEFDFVTTHGSKLIELIAQKAGDKYQVRIFVIISIILIAENYFLYFDSCIVSLKRTPPICITYIFLLRLNVQKLTVF